VPLARPSASPARAHVAPAVPGLLEPVPIRVTQRVVARAAPPILDLLGPKPGERKAAVVRILEVELARLQTALDLAMAGPSLHPKLKSKAPSTEEIAEEFERREPMLRWAAWRWMVDSLGIEKYGVWCPTLKRLQLHPWQWTPKDDPTFKPPTFLESLRALRPTLEAEIKRGFWIAPVAVMRLAYRATIVYALAAFSNLPGPQRKLIQRTWPKIVEHLADTLEANHDAVLRAPLETDSSERALEWRKRVAACAAPVRGAATFCTARCTGAASWCNQRRQAGTASLLGVLSLARWQLGKAAQRFRPA